MTKRTAKQKALDGAIRQGMGDGLDRFELFFNTYQKQIFYGAGIAVLVIAAIAGIVSYNISANRAAAEAFGSAKSEDQLVAALEKYGDNDLSYFARQRLARLYAAEPKVEVKAYSGLLVDFAREEGARFIVKGVRSVKDFEYEREQADINLRIGGLDTLLLFSEPQYQSVSSSMVRELLHFGRDVSEFLPTGN